MSSEAGRGVLVAIQAYNCDRTIGGVVKQCRSHAPDVLVVDDGSEDATADQARAAGARLLRHDRNRGKGMAIRTAASEALRGGYSGLLTVDGDAQHEAEDLPAFLEAHRGSPHTMWVGWRRDALERAPVARRLGNQFSNLALKLLAGVRLPDTQCGLRLYPIKLLRSLSLCGTRYETEPEILVKARAIDWDMRPLPVHVRFVDGRPTSHFRPWADTARICILVMRHYLQRRLASRGGIAMTLAVTHTPLFGTAAAAILGIFSPGAILGQLHPGNNDVVDEAVFLGFCCGHEMIAVGVLDNAIHGLAGMLHEKAVQLIAHAENFSGVNVDVRGLALDTGEGLVNQDPRIRKRKPFALLTRCQEKGAHARGLADTNGRDLGLDVLHRVVDTQTRRHRAARAVDVHRNVPFRLIGLEEQKLRRDHVGDVIVDCRSQEDNPVLEEAAINVVSAFASTRLFHNHRDKSHNWPLSTMNRQVRLIRPRNRSPVPR